MPKWSVFAVKRSYFCPLGSVAGVGPSSIVRPTGMPLTILTGTPLLGRVVDGYGEAIDDGPPLSSMLSELLPTPSSVKRQSRCVVAASPSRCRLACAPLMAVPPSDKASVWVCLQGLVLANRRCLARLPAMPARM